MKPNPTKPNRALAFVFVLGLGFASSVQCATPQFVELTAEIETVWWNSYGTHPPSVNPYTFNVRCVVGPNTWLIEGDFSRNAKLTFWFTGTNIIEETVITKEVADAARRKLSELSGFAMVSPHVGERSTNSFESTDGNPGRPVRVADLLFVPGKICWLAYCSGPCLKREGRQIPLPDDLWKEFLPDTWQASEKTTVFEDEFGLPERIGLYAKNNQPVLEYRATWSTNVLGWNFPLEFYLAQYQPVGTNAWGLRLTAKGSITGIKEGIEPQIGADERKPGGDEK